MQIHHKPETWHSKIPLSFFRLAASLVEEQQVLLTRNELENVRLQVAGGMRATYVFLLYHLENIAKSAKGQDAAYVRAVLAEAEDRLR